MLKKIILPLAALFLVTGCDTINGWMGWSQTPVAAPAPPPAPPPTVSFMMFFDWDSAKLTPQALTAAHEAAEAFRARSATRATINGHTDTTGSNAYNMKLSAKRADAVKEALVKEGIPAAAIVVNSSGESGALVPTADQVKEPRNRRVEVVISK
jgi:outer membrane protein OmpA-like peptidoglycan-associated protein